MTKQDPKQSVLEFLDTLDEHQDGKNIVLAPKVILASSLFTTRNNKQPRTFFRNHSIIVAPGLGSLEFHGEELRYDDMSVWQAIVDQARTNEIHKKNYTLKTTVSSMLKCVGWGSGGKDYDHLKTCLIRLKANALTATSKITDVIIKSVSLIRDYTIREPANGGPFELEIVLNEEIYKLFKRDDVALLLSDAMRAMPALTRKVYEIIRTELKEDISVAEYMHLSGNNYKHVRQFKPRLITALKQLHAGNYISAWTISEKNIVHVQIASL